MIRNGQLDAAIVGGTDALCKFTLNGFNSLMILDKEHCRPFDASRAGLNLGEGAGYIVLQSEKLLRKEPYCLLSGYSNVNEAFHQTGSSPEGNGPFWSMTEAIAKSEIPPEEIDYINVHGTGTPSNDLSEGLAIRRIFGFIACRWKRFAGVRRLVGFLCAGGICIIPRTTTGGQREHQGACHKQGEEFCKLRFHMM